MSRTEHFVVAGDYSFARAYHGLITNFTTCSSSIFVQQYRISHLNLKIKKVFPAKLHGGSTCHQLQMETSHMILPSCIARDEHPQGRTRAVPSLMILLVIALRRAPPI